LNQRIYVKRYDVNGMTRDLADGKNQNINL